MKGTLEPFLKQTGFNTKTDVYFIPVSGFTGANLKHRVSEEICPWYKGPSLLQFLDELQVSDGFSFSAKFTFVKRSHRYISSCMGAGVHLTFPRHISCLRTSHCAQPAGSEAGHVLSSQPQQRFFDLPLRFPIADKYKDMGTVVLGKLEAGTIKTGEQLVVLPNKSPIVVSSHA